MKNSIGFSRAQKVLIFGSTGSIGTQTLDVIREHPDNFKIIGLIGFQNKKLLKKQQEKFSVPKIVLLQQDNQKIISSLIKKADLIVNAISGSAGIRPSIEILKAGKTLLLANKESLVSCGKILKELAKKNHTKIIPIDSELTGMLQCLQGGRREEIEKIILTCSGGPFHRKTKKNLKKVSLNQALRHPTWSMGQKTTIDSATLMNKGFELITTSILFDIPPDKIEIVIHSESIMHAMIQWKDGNVSAALSPVDMRHTIQYALFYGTQNGKKNGMRKKNKFPRLNFTDLKLTFRKPDEKTFKTLSLARKAAKIQGNLPAILNATNEQAVKKFLNGEISFLEIFDYLRKHVSLKQYKSDPSIEDILALHEKQNTDHNSQSPISPNPHFP